MENFKYILMGVLWVLSCVAVGYFIRSGRFSKSKQIKIGFAAVFVSYLLGLSIMAVAILM